MKLLNRWIARKCREAWEEAQERPEDVDYSTSSKRTRGKGIGLAIGLANDSNPGDSAPTINFSLSFAQGGKIITTTYYEPKTDRHNRTVHVIPDDEDFAERVKEIVFKECLTRG